jgi:Ca-activated chloride channel family protein
MKTELLLDQEIHPQGYVVHALLKIEGEAPRASNRTPLNLSIVLDRSGSMGGPKLSAARDAAAMLVQRLAPEDIVSVVAYDNHVATVAEPASGTNAQLTNEIRNIQAGGSTNLSGGWLRGRDYVSRNYTPKHANRVLLLTDGLANVGITDHDQLVGMCAQANEHGIRTTTIGFGQDYDENLLGRMAEAGGGHMHYIEHSDQAAAIFGEELSGLLSLAAQNLTLTIQPADAAAMVAVHHSYPRYETADGLRLELGDLYAREPKLVLIEMLVTAGPSAAVDVARLTLQAAVLAEDGSIKQQEIVVNVTTSPADGPVSNAEVRRELLLLEAARVREEALADQRNGNYHAAFDKMQRMSEKLRAAGLNDAQVEEEAADLQLMSAQMSPDSWGVAETKYMHQRAYDSSKATRAKMQHIARTKRQKPNPDA